MGDVKLGTCSGAAVVYKPRVYGWGKWSMRVLCCLFFRRLLLSAERKTARWYVLYVIDQFAFLCLVRWRRGFRYRYTLQVDKITKESSSTTFFWLDPRRGTRSETKLITCGTWMLTVLGGNYLQGNATSWGSCMWCLLHSALQAIPAARSFIVSLNIPVAEGWKTICLIASGSQTPTSHSFLLFPILKYGKTSNLLRSS